MRVCAYEEHTMDLGSSRVKQMLHSRWLKHTPGTQFMYQLSLPNDQPSPFSSTHRIQGAHTPVSPL